MVRLVHGGVLVTAGVSNRKNGIIVDLHDKIKMSAKERIRSHTVPPSTPNLTSEGDCCTYREIFQDKTENYTASFATKKQTNT